jgi:hypothetical protein
MRDELTPGSEDEVTYKLDCGHEFHLGCLFKCLGKRKS